MTLAFEKPLVPRTAFPESTQQQPGAPKLDISVVFTSVKWTLHALRHAGALAQGLSARITLIVPQIVPYPLPLESPPVLLDFNERRFFTIANENRIENVNSHLPVPRSSRTAVDDTAPALVGAGGRPQALAADAGAAAGQTPPADRARSDGCGRGVNMLDLAYLTVGCVVLLVFWTFTRACDKL